MACKNTTEQIILIFLEIKRHGMCFVCDFFRFWVAKSLETTEADPKFKG